jgi:putative nucleotidyltransferase with HDIG domain
MFNRPSDEQSIPKQFQDAKTLLMTVIGSLSRAGDPVLSSAVQDITRLAHSLNRLEESVREQMRIRESRLGALVGTGGAINSSLGLTRVLEEVMDALIALMRAERGFLMLRDPHGELKPEISRGMDHTDLDKDDFTGSRTVLRRVAESGEPILTTNAQEDTRFGGQMSVAAYQLRSILCAPLKIKEELIGVIYVDNRARAGIFQNSDLHLIKAFSDQAAMAIHNARLFEKLKATNIELERANFKLEAANLELKIAYDATLNGWVRALDLRDKETEGHTQRVTVLTERLARMLGVIGDDLIHITRGALLHDIGKMAIPDSILKKEGPLTEEEREVIKTHPVHAYEMLSPIEFLRPALDIPYCHHEKWDGTGYPRGLRGEDIPFAARIFPVIDVWDALVSDRPYRKALPHEEVRRHIAADAGKHFDPRVVEAFMEMKDLSI